jgi:hypothetical protein
VNVLVALAALRVNDKEYVSKWVKSLEPDVKTLETPELLKLAMSFIVYAGHWEKFYRQVHEACEKNSNRFSAVEKQKLGKVFGRVKTHFPNSPFITEK